MSRVTIVKTNKYKSSRDIIFTLFSLPSAHFSRALWAMICVDFLDHGFESWPVNPYFAYGRAEAEINKIHLYKLTELFKNNIARLKPDTSSNFTSRMRQNPRSNLGSENANHHSKLTHCTYSIDLLFLKELTTQSRLFFYHR